ncbi:hypothetical protein Phab24_id133 [Acinetobacter phage Phab24]|nr:hypothetical protein Phab24_id133 [Acinetobacter phage Phab24]
MKILEKENIFDVLENFKNYVLAESKTSGRCALHTYQNVFGDKLLIEKVGCEYSVTLNGKVIYTYINVLEAIEVL